MDTLAFIADSRGAAGVCTFLQGTWRLSLSLLLHMATKPSLVH